MTTSSAAPDSASGPTSPSACERNELVVRHMPLAKRLAHRYSRVPDYAEDVEQVAAIGLIKAAQRFDASRGYAFSSYAVPTIVGEIKRYFRDACWAVHVPRALQERAQRVDAAIVRLSDELGRAPSASEVADALGITAEDVLEARAAYSGFRAESLDAPAALDGEGDVLGDRLGGVDDAYEQVEHRVAIEPALARLPERDRHALSLRFDRELTQREIGRRLGVSQMHVSRILTHSLETLRAAIEY